MHTLNPYKIYLDKIGQMTLHKNEDVFFRSDIFSKLLAETFSSIRVLSNAWFGSKKINGNIYQIIDSIHKEQFNPKIPYIISGDHFVDLYSRDYGIFYAAALDPRFALNKKDWINRQKTMLQTAALHLDLLSKSKEAYTTYMPLNKNTFVGVNVWANPSDALFSLFLTLSSLTNDDFLLSLYPHAQKKRFRIKTKKQGELLIHKYRNLLEMHTKRLIKKVIDPKTQLVYKDIKLSGVRDHVKRESAFYDNVVIWATVKMADELCIRKVNKAFLKKWKEIIISEFWDENVGIFLDDKSEESKRSKVFCADSLIVVAAQLLKVSDKKDRDKLEKIISYVINNNLDKPFPVWYSKQNPLNKMYLISKILFPSYVGKAIFSHWGIEFIKIMIMLGKYNKAYYPKAEKYLDLYEKQIEKYGGYPEIYDTKGNLFQTFLYRGVLHTGWIINYEQARMLLKKSIKI